MNLKRIMTDLAAGRITKEQADNLVEEIKTPQNKPERKFKEKEKKDTHKRPKQLNETGGKIKSQDRII